MTTAVRPRRRRSAGTASRLPSREQLLRYLADHPDAASQRELVRAFALKGQERELLRAMLRELQADGLLAGRGRGARDEGGLPAVAVLEVSAIDADGELIARPSGRADNSPDPLPEIRLTAAPRGPAPAPGDRVLARLERQDEGWRGQIIGFCRRARPGSSGWSRAPRGSRGSGRSARARACSSSSPALPTRSRRASWWWPSAAARPRSGVTGRS